MTVVDPAQRAPMVRREDLEPQAWQGRALRYGDSVPALAAARSYLGHNVSRLTLRPRVGPPGGDVTDDTSATSARSGLSLAAFPLGRAAELLFVAGRCWVAAWPQPTLATPKWVVFSDAELQLQPDRPPKLTTGGHQEDLYDARLPAAARPLVFDIWRPSLQDQRQPWSAVQTLLGELEALYLLGLAMSLAAKQRLNAGILYLPSEAMLPEELDADGVLIEQSMLDKLTTAILDPVSRPDSPSSLVPIIITGPAEFADKIRHVMVQARTDPEKLRFEHGLLMEQLGIGLDLPKMAVRGDQGTAKFDNLNEMREDQVRSYIVPYGELVADALTERWWRVWVSVDPAAHVAVDWSDLVPQKDRTASLLDALARGLIGPEVVLREIGVDSSDGLEVGSSAWWGWVAGQMATKANTTLDPALLEAVVALARGETPTPLALPAPAPTAAHAIEASARAQPSSRQRLAMMSEALDRADAELAASASSLASSTVAEVLRAVGVRVRQAASQGRTPRDPAVVERAKLLAPSALAADVGALKVAALGVDEQRAIDEAENDHEEALLAALLLMRRHQRGALLAAGVPGETLDAHDSEVAAWGLAAVSVWRASTATVARRLLFDPTGGVGSNSDGSPPGLRGEWSGRVPAIIGRLTTRVASGATVASGVDVDGFPMVDGAVGVGDSPHIGPALADAGWTGAWRTWTWSHGVPIVAFEAHERLDRFATRDPAGDEALVTAAEHAWIGSHYRPGDHGGCTCRWVVGWSPATDLGR